MSEPQQPSTPKRVRTPQTQHDWKPGFLMALRDTGNVRAAAHAAQVDRSTVYRARQTDRDFAGRWRVMLEDAADLLEAEARRRAVFGTEEPVYQRGEKVGTVRKYSDVLLIFLLKGARPERYRERFDVTHLTVDQVDAEIARLRAELGERAGDEVVPSE